MVTGELTAARALDRLRREAPAAVWTAAGAVVLTAAAIVIALGGEKAEPYELLARLGLGLADRHLRGTRRAGGRRSAWAPARARAAGRWSARLAVDAGDRHGRRGGHRDAARPVGGVARQLVVHGPARAGDVAAAAVPRRPPALAPLAAGGGAGGARDRVDRAARRARSRRPRRDRRQRPQPARHPGVVGLGRRARCLRVRDPDRRGGRDGGSAGPRPHPHRSRHPGRAVGVARAGRQLRALPGAERRRGASTPRR